MKARMISFCETQHDRVLPMFESLSEALCRAQKASATVIHWGLDMNSCEGLIQETVDLERTLALVASKILRNCAAGLEKVGYEGLPFDQAIAWFESRYSLHPQEDPGIVLMVHGRGEDLYRKTLEQPSDETRVRKDVLEMTDNSAVRIVAYFIHWTQGYKCLQDEAEEVVQMIEKELDRRAK